MSNVFSTLLGSYTGIAVLVIAAIAIFGFFAGRGRALTSGGGDRRNLHSLPNYYGWNVALFGMVPAIALLAAWSIGQPMVLQSAVSDMISQERIEETGSLGLAMSDVRRLAEGLDLATAQGALDEGSMSGPAVDLDSIRTTLAGLGVALGAKIDESTFNAAQAFRAGSETGNAWKMLLAVAVSAAGTGLAFLKTNAAFRARNTVELGILTLLIAAASIAILTTVGILLSLIFNTVEFFRLYPMADFFFGTTWQPSFSGRGGASELGILPLLWGTLYISVVALLVAVPIGLFAAIYLSEYATPAVRGFAKPLLEVLAGIPTIVYGLFALLIVGPMLKDVFGAEGALSFAAMTGDRSVMTAGLVMGIMLIPFVSSLSDDIINAVPQSMRDGSLGLGATPSETIRKVVLPAALPGIVGAILLAASRAIGETMIVVLGAGAAGRLDLNPFEAMTTVTAKIVSQLTGDSDFSSPEALVAFALGMTLFIFTLGLNVLALYIVRKYREQIE